jgi:hypothetical protein
MWLQLSGEKLEWWEPLGADSYRLGIKSGTEWIVVNYKGIIEARRVTR